MKQSVETTHIQGMWLVKGQRFHDDRGCFEELYNENESPVEIRVDKLRQLSVATSKRAVLRGLHTSPYSKLVTVLQGAVYDVVVDFREDSPTFGKWVANILSSANCTSIHVPAGCAHGYLALEDTMMIYMQQGTYDASLEQDVTPFDQDLRIHWPKIGGATSYIMSMKDSVAPRLRSRRLNVASTLPTGRHLVLGVSGQVGRALVEELGSPNCFGTYSTNVVSDATQLSFHAIASQPDIFAHLLTSTKPDVVYICAAKTWVDDCESQEQEVMLVNHEVPALIVKITKDFGAKVVFFSTDYVFDGVAGPYGEDAETSPVNMYGRSKLEAEKAIVAIDSGALIIRTTIVYGPEEFGKNFVYQLAKKLVAGEKYACLDDQYGTPTYSRDLAKMVTKLVSKGCSGLYNCTGTEVMNRYEFAMRVTRTLRLDSSLLERVSTNSLQAREAVATKSSAKRGLKLGLRMEKTLECLGIFTPRTVEQSLCDWLEHPIGKPLIQTDTSYDLSG